jgi:hypothetical protein
VAAFLNASQNLYFTLMNKRLARCSIKTVKVKSGIPEKLVLVIRSIQK